MKKEEKSNTISLSRRIFLYLLDVAFLSVISFAFFSIESKLNEYHWELKLLKRTFSEAKKTEIKNKILLVKDYIQWIQDDPLEPISRTLANQVNQLKFPVIKEIGFSGKFPDQLSRGLKDSICKSRVPIYIINNYGEIVYSCNPLVRPENTKFNEDELVMLHQLQKGKSVKGILSIYKTVGTRDSTLKVIGYYDNKILPSFKVISMVKQVNFEDLLQFYILDSISRLRYSENEYIFINEFNGKALLTNGKFNKIPINIIESGKKEWINIFKVQQSSAARPGGVFYSYTWQKLSNSKASMKTSYFNYIPRWKWIIGTGFYEDDINLIIGSKKAALYASMRKDLLNVLYYLLISSLLSYLLVAYFSRQFEKNVKLFKIFFKKAAEENLLIDQSKLKYEEFVHIAEAANYMVEERRLADMALKESESLYRYLFEQNPAPMLIYELDSLKMLAVNEAFTNHYGYSVGEALTMRLPDLYPENEKKAISDVILNLTGHAYAGEWHHIKKDGTLISIEAHSHSFSYEGRASRVAVINDITDRKQMEEVLRVNENQLSAIFNTISDILYLVSIEPNETYRFISVNEMFLKATGLKKEQVINKTILEVIPQPAQELVLGKYREAIETKQTVFWEEISDYPAGKKYGLVRITPTYNEQGISTNLVGSVHDITGIRETEKKILELNAVLEDRVIERTVQLESSNKELESFSYSISHDLRAPLRAIFGFSQILSSRHRASLNDEGQQYMDYIVEASIRMEQLINDLLNYSRLGRKTLRLHPVSLNVIVAGIRADFKQQLKEIGAKLIVDKELPQIIGDETLLRQIFTNLIGNAITYRRTDVPLKISISFEMDVNGYILKITDNGIGIPQEYWEKIFNVFQRLHSEDKYPGTGIGLATVKKAAALLGGSVWVESIVGEGSTFFIKIQEHKI